jgi:hypothetical protein
MAALQVVFRLTEKRVKRHHHVAEYSTKPEYKTLPQRQRELRSAEAILQEQPRNPSRLRLHRAVVV